MSDSKSYADNAQAVDKLLAYAILDFSSVVPTSQVPPPFVPDPNLDRSMTHGRMRGRVRFGSGSGLHLRRDP